MLDKLQKCAFLPNSSPNATFCVLLPKTDLSIAQKKIVEKQVDVWNNSRKLSFYVYSKANK